jgi:hypothetical protein
MRNQIQSLGTLLLLGLGFPSLSTAHTAGVVAAQTINQPSIQINLRTHQQYYRNGKEDQETWSWTPWIEYRVVGPISAGSQLSVEFTLPSGKPWLKFDCLTKETKDGYWWPTECGDRSGSLKQQATIETGVVSFKIILKNELEGTNKTLFAGKFRVEKFLVGVVDLPKFKNNFAYYVNYDWNLPIGYLYDYDIMDFRAGGHPPSAKEGRLNFVTWFRGSPKLMNYGKYVAYLYYQGKLVADSTLEPDTYSITSCEVTNAADRGDDPEPLTYCRRMFGLKAMVWDQEPQFRPPSYFKMYEHPGEYEIKILQNGKLARMAKFTMGANYQLVDTGIGKQNNLGTGRFVVPVQIIGDQDGQWDRNAYKTDAFFGNPLSGLVVP